MQLERELDIPSIARETFVERDSMAEPRTRMHGVRLYNKLICLYC
jgi:hypothetical protein